MRNIYLAQVNNLYGTNAFLPYSVGLLQAFALTNQDIKDNYKFCGFVYLREQVDVVVARLSNPDVFGLSCYIWNWEYNMALARAVKEAFPGCLIVLGGPHVPVRSENFFKEHSYADILIHYEGELAFTDVLLERLKDRPDYTQIGGLSVSINTDTIKTPARQRIENLDSLPSPYLTGVFDEIINDPYDFHASQETHRGCPYSCTFCDWGSNILAKVKMFGTDRLVNEINWFADHKIDLLYNCDANYGLFKRDIDLTQQMADIKTKTGYPRKFRAAYAKNSNETVYTIAKILNKAEMNKGITLSFQSMDDHTLEVIKRKNIKIDNFKELMGKYRSENIATYSEIIIGLPGETYNSFANGLNTLIDCGQHDSIQVYNCEVLPNSEMNDLAYRTKHGIETANTPVLFFHGTPSNDPYQEQYELVVGTTVLPRADWLKCHRLAWIMQSFHCLSLTQIIAIYLNPDFVDYRGFYEMLLDFADNSPDSTLGRVVRKVTELFNNIPQGKHWGVVDGRFGNIVWPPEEGAFLDLVTQKEAFYRDVTACIKSAICLDYNILDDVVAYQEAMIHDPYQPEVIKLELTYNIPEIISSAYEHKIVYPRRDHATYEIRPKKTYNGDLETYAREVVWYGRKGGKFQHTEVKRV